MTRKSDADPDDDRGPAAPADAAARWFARRDAGLTAAEEAAFRRWLSADRRNAEAFARVESTWSLFGKPQRTGEASQVAAILERRAERRRHRRLTAAAAIMLLLAVTTAATWRSLRGPAAPAMVASNATILSPSRLTLPDGTIVLLKQNAQVRETYTAAFRRVELTRGEAMFEVRKDPSRPFIVSANGVEVRAVGTAFSVQLGRAEVEVVIAEGTVAIAPSPAPAEPPPAQPTAARAEATASSHEALASAPGVLVSAGNRALIRPGHDHTPEVTPMADHELHERLAWRQPRVEFSNTPLREAVDLLNREAGSVRLVIADPELASARVSGIFRTEQIDAFVLLLEAGFGVRAERSADTIRLYRAQHSR